MILVVHRSAPLRRLLVASLAELDRSVVAASTAEQALELIKRHEGHFSLLVTGNILPGMDGPELALRFRQCCGPVVPVIMTSAYERPPDGACDVFIREPFEVADVVRAARRLTG
ncbi:MAG: response regulator [Dehalococcoidia bacterium]|nr:response regulator [Dehalococcoidia bacterium]